MFKANTPVVESEVNITDVKDGIRMTLKSPLETNAGRLIVVKLVRCAPVLPLTLTEEEIVPNIGAENEAINGQAFIDKMPVIEVSKGNSPLVSTALFVTVSPPVKTAKLGVPSVVIPELPLTVSPALDVSAGKLIVVKAALVLLPMLINPVEVPREVRVSEVSPAPAVTVNPLQLVIAPRFNPVNAASVVKLNAPAVCNADKLIVVSDAQVPIDKAVEDVRTGHDMEVRLAQSVMVNAPVSVVKAGNE